VKNKKFLEPIVIEGMYDSFERANDGTPLLSFSVHETEAKNIREVAKIRGLVFLLIVPEEDYLGDVGLEH